MDRESKTRHAENAPPVESDFLIRVFSLRFLLIAFTYGAIAFIMVGTTVHIIPHATDQGFTPRTSAFIFLLWGICLIGGNLVSIMSDHLGRSQTYAIGATLGIGVWTLLAFFVQGMPLSPRRQSYSTY